MIAERLKKAILQDAIQGKLTKQLATDGNAQELLQQINTEKYKLIAEKKLKKEKPLPKITEEEIPFDIPDNWVWCRLGEVAQYIQRGKSPKYSEIKKYPVIAQKCNQWSGFSIEKAKFIEPSSIEKYANERWLQDLDLLWNSTGLGTLGRVARYYKKNNPYNVAVADSHVTVMRMFKEFVNPIYIYYYLASPIVQNVIEDKSSGSTKQKELYTDTIKFYEIPLPPLEEQRRIVEKIEELFPLLDSLQKDEVALKQREAKFPMQLKQALLQDAIQGKLTEQLATDGNAQDLLVQIKAEKEKLIEQKKIKKEKSLPEIAEEEIPFAIPDNWVWCRLGEIGVYKKGPFGSALTKSMFIPKSKNSIKVYEQKNAIQKDWTLGEYNIPKEYYEKKMKGFTVYPQDIIVSCAGTIGETYIMPDEIEVGIINQALMRVTLMLMLDKKYFLTYFDYILKAQAKYTSKGSAIKNIPPFDILKNMLFPLPPLSEQKRIVEKLEQLLPLFEKME